jgi:hypothetical protein
MTVDLGEVLECLPKNFFISEVIKKRRPGDAQLLGHVLGSRLL